MSQKPVRFSGHCVLDGCLINVEDALGQIPVIGGDVDRAIFKHVASAVMQYMSRPARPGEGPSHVKVTKGPDGALKVDGPIVSESEAAQKFLEYRMLCYVGSADPRLDAFRSSLRQEILSALDAPPRPSPNGTGLLAPS
jgi:hypothetical protein